MVLGKVFLKLATDCHRCCGIWIQTFFAFVKYKLSDNAFSQALQTLTGAVFFVHRLTAHSTMGSAQKTRFEAIPLCCGSEMARRCVFTSCVDGVTTPLAIAAEGLRLQG